MKDLNHMNTRPTFLSLGLSAETCEQLRKKGFEYPTPIQEQTIPLLLANEVDVVGQAQTGTGKTAAFGLPIIDLLDTNNPHVQALVLAPTRELALQVAQEIQSFSPNKQLNVVTIYGGQSMDVQVRQLRRNANIVVGTPGRIKDHLSRGTLKLNNIKFMVLDEADEMLNMGFIDDVEEIVQYTNDTKRMLLFSATMPSRILELAKKYMREFKVVSVKTPQLTTNLTEQLYYAIPSRDKTEALCRIIDINPDFYGVVFCRTKRDVDTVTSTLIDRGYSAEGLHGDISQARRERILDLFKRKKTTILVATDVAARGIDVSNLTHVVNHALPEDPESYVHRIGRTGRAGNKGIAISLVSPSESRKLALIKRVAKAPITQATPPDSADIVAAKKALFNADIAAILSSGAHQKFVSIAQELLATDTPQNVLAAVLKRAFNDELDAAHYKKIEATQLRESSGRDYSDRESSRGGRYSDRESGRDYSDRGGRSRSGDRESFRKDSGPRKPRFADDGTGTRLFVARGKDDGMNPKKLVDFIADKTNVKRKDITGVAIMEGFSFITVPDQDADTILRSFTNDRSGQKPLITRAKAR